MMVSMGLNSAITPKFGIVTVHYVPEGTHCNGEIGETKDGTPAFTDIGLDGYVRDMVSEFKVDPTSAAAMTPDADVIIKKYPETETATFESSRQVEATITEHLMYVVKGLIKGWE